MRMTHGNHHGNHIHGNHHTGTNTKQCSNITLVDGWAGRVGTARAVPTRQTKQQEQQQPTPPICICCGVSAADCLAWRIGPATRTTQTNTKQCSSITLVDGLVGRVGTARAVPTRQTKTTTATHETMGSWVHGFMGSWVHGFMGSYGFMGFI